MSIDASRHYIPFMSKIALIAKLTAAEGKADEMKAALADLIAAADSESGLEIYSAHADADDPNTFYFFELYADQAALEVHGKEEPMRGAMKTLGGLLGGRPEVTRLTPVVAKGLEL
jgi:quinol monooxygenase YgiN